MKLLLDENLPVKLKFRFREAGFAAFTVRDMLWNGKSNGELLQLMLTEGFTAFLTIDSNLSFQQNFIDYPLHVVVLIASDNTYETIMKSFSMMVDRLHKQKIGVDVVVHPDHFAGEA